MQLTDLEHKALDLMTESGLEFCDRRLVSMHNGSLRNLVRLASKYRESNQKACDEIQEGLELLRKTMIELKSKIIDE